MELHRVAFSILKCVHVKALTRATINTQYGHCDEDKYKIKNDKQKIGMSMWFITHQAQALPTVVLIGSIGSSHASMSIIFFSPSIQV